MSYVYAGKKYGRIRLWWTGLTDRIFFRGFGWFHTCRFPVSQEPRKECRRLFWGKVTRSARSRGGKQGYCPEHRATVRAGWARFAEAQRRNREAWCATLKYACCTDHYILSTDSRGTFFYVDTREWPEWAALPEGAKREPDAAEKYMLPFAKGRWASLNDWQWIEYAPESGELKRTAERHVSLLTALKAPDVLNRRPS